VFSKKDLKTNGNGPKTAFKGINKLVFAKIVSEKLISYIEKDRLATIFRKNSSKIGNIKSSMLQQLKGQCNKNLAEFFEGPENANKKEIKSHKLRCLRSDTKMPKNGANMSSNWRTGH
jgi:hypothetical protein